MEFADFITQVKSDVEKRVGDGYRVRINDVRKNNGVVLSGLTITHDDSNISPTIYLNNYYKVYESGGITLTSVADDVMDTYFRNKVNKSMNMGYFMDYECVKECIVYKLINTEKNRELLEDIPHMEYLDLSVVFQCLVAKEDFGTASILIHNAHMKLWDISVEELYRKAAENTQRIQGYEIKGINDAICEIMRANDPEGFDRDACMAELEGSVPMYILSNKQNVNGASCMLYPDLIKDFAETLGSSIYIIPSSIHELLLLPASNADESGEIKGMVREINDTEVKAEEILSYSLYFYDMRESRIIRL